MSGRLYVNCILHKGLYYFSQGNCPEYSESADITKSYWQYLVAVPSSIVDK